MKPKELTVKVKSLKKIKADVFLLSFDSAHLATSCPGQFLHIKIKKTSLRRPFSVHLVKGRTIYILFRIRGRGTKILSGYKTGAKLNVIGPLGKGFGYEGRETRGERRILVAGGLGVAPLLFLAEKLRRLPKAENQRPEMVLLGAKSKKEILCEEKFKKLRCQVFLATEDGSKGKKGTVIDILKTLIPKSKRINIYSCGPEEMFKSINKIIGKNKNINCEVSFEQFMGCGLGFCCGCTIKTKKGYKKVCKDGPVFNLRDIW